MPTRHHLLPPATRPFPLTCTSTPDMRCSSRRSMEGSSSPGADAPAAAALAEPGCSAVPAAMRGRGVTAALGGRLMAPTRTSSAASSNCGSRRWRSVTDRVAQSVASGSGPAVPSSHCSQVPTFWLKKTRRLGVLRLRACRKRSPAAEEQKPNHLPCSRGDLG